MKIVFFAMAVIFSLSSFAEQVCYDTRKETICVNEIIDYGNGIVELNRISTSSSDYEHYLKPATNKKKICKQIGKIVDGGRGWSYRIGSKFVRTAGRLEYGGRFNSQDRIKETPIPRLVSIQCNR